MPEIQDTERPRFTVIHHGVMLSLGISANEYLILDTVYHLSAKHGYCYKSSFAMAYDLGLTDRGVRKIITRLLDRGLLDRSAAGLVCGKAYTSVAYVEQSSAKPRNKVPAKRNKVPKAGTKLPIAEQSTSKKYSKDIQENNTEITTDVVGADAPEVFGKTDINDMFLYWEQTVGIAVSSKTKANRFACSNLLKKHHTAGLRKLIEGVAKAQQTPYAPRIADFCQLQSKLTDLLVWGRAEMSKEQSQQGIVL